MTPVSQFAQYLLKQDPKTNGARLTLYNYLKHVLEPTLPFTPAVLENFYARVLQFDQWRNDSRNLGESVKSDVHSWLNLTRDEKELAAWAKVRHADALQVVTIQQIDDMEDLVATEHEDRPKSGDRVKIVRLSDTQILTVILRQSGGLEVKVYPNLALVMGAKLKLVAPVTHLHYGPDFELMPYVRQLLEGSLLTTHSFQIDEDGVQGLVTRGQSFQKYETYIRAPLPETQDLFTSLKRLERHFINPQSDPYYQEIVSKLERANRLLNNPTTENLMTAERALNKGRIFLKNAFPNDRLLGLLITHLDYGISQRRTEAGAQA